MSTYTVASDCLKDIITDIVIDGLANKLKKQCYDNGEEINPKESAKTLHQLGLEYKEKSPDKISLIQSVALMTSAVLRQPDNADKISKDLDDACLHIMTLADAANPDTELVRKAVAETKRHIQIFRENTKDKLSELKPMSDDIKGEKLNVIRRQRVKQVMKIQKFVSKTYIETMALVADYTEHIIGKRPCEFALVGMGSLAKKEVTPYSDFESIIVLEEGIQKRPDYENILEYFQWFATVCQMILVRLGETILTCLAIPCLNNPLNKEENWFYDAYTTCGIRPDGFAPQASKNPLGRQTKTQKKPWTTELIKPVSEMVQYLETEEDLKNGYHLADMLTITCFIFGNSIISEQFESKVDKKLNQMSIFNRRAQQNIKKDFDLYQLNPLNLIGKVDIKRVALRSCSLFVLALGRLYKCNKLTCFDILDELLDRRIMNETLHGKLQFSLAVACEMRLRWYSKLSSQDDIVHQSIYFYQPSNIEYITKNIGNRAVVSGINIALSLQKYVADCFEEKRCKTTICFAESPVRAALLAVFMQLFTFAFKFVEECIFSGENLDKADELIFKIIHALCVFRTDEFQVFKLCDDGSLGLNLPEFFKQEFFFEHLQTLSDAKENDRKSNVLMNVNTGWLYLANGDHTKALQNFEFAYNEVKKDRTIKLDNYFNCVFLFGFNMCLIHVGCYDKALSVNEELISERRTVHVNEETDSFLHYAFMLKCTSLQQLKRHEEVLVSCDKAYKYKTWETSDDLLTMKANSLLELGRLTEAEKFFTEVWPENMELLKQNANKSVTNIWQLDVPYHDISTHLVKDGRPHDAVRFDKMSFQLSIYLDRLIKRSVTTTCSLVTNLYRLRRYEECHAAAKHGIKLCQFVYENCGTKGKFVHIFKTLLICEWELEIWPPTVPYESTPSIFFHAGFLLHKRLIDLTDSVSIHNFPLRNYVFAKSAAHKMLNKAIQTKKL